MSSKSVVSNSELIPTFSKKAWCHFPNNRDILGLGLPSDNNFQPITSFVSLALLWQRDSGRCNLLGYGRKHVTCCLRELFLGYFRNCSHNKHRRGPFSTRPSLKVFEDHRSVLCRDKTIFSYQGIATQLSGVASRNIKCVATNCYTNTVAYFDRWYLTSKFLGFNLDY